MIILSQVLQEPRPVPPLQEARILLFRPSLAEVYSIDRQRLSLPSLVNEVTTPSVSDVAQFMDESFHFSIPPERYQFHHTLVSLQTGNLLTYYVARLSPEERYPYENRNGISIYAIARQAISAGLEDRLSIGKLVQKSSLC